MKFANFVKLLVFVIFISVGNSKFSFNLKSGANSLFQKNKTFLSNKNGKLHEKFSAKLNSSKNTSKNNLSTSQNPNSSNTPSFQGWLKFLEISDDIGDIPDCFNKNKMFFLQMTENPSMNSISKDNMGYLNIPNEQFFWFELDNTQIAVYTARNPRYRKKENSLKISDLIPETGTNPCKGGVEDVGNFTEGYCFMLKFLKFSKHYIWELCAESEAEKNQWMDRIIRNQQKNSLASNLNLQGNTITSQSIIIPNTVNTNSLFSNQHHITHSVTHIVHKNDPFNQMNQGSLPGSGWAPAGAWSQCSQPCGSGIQSRPLRCLNPPHCMGPEFETRLCQIKACKADLDQKMGNLQKIADGNWELLGTWSECSKPCGGGIQSIERRCLSQNCQGNPLLTQPCNLNPCGAGNNPQMNTYIQNNMNIIDPLNKNSVEECRMIEGNLSLMNSNGMMGGNIHVILTSNHLDIYPENQGNNYNSLSPQQTFILSHITSVNQLSGNNNCFKVKDDIGSSANLCGSDSQKSYDWMKKIEDYKEKCNNKILEKITSEMEHCLTPTNAEQKLNTISQQVMQEQLSSNQNKGFLLERQFQEFQNQVRDLLNKEDAYEAHLENQEKERIMKEKIQMQALVSKEETMAKNLAQEMHMLKSTENDYEIKEITVKRKMKNMMEDIQKQINQKRSHLIEKLERMRRMHAIEQKVAAKKLIDIKRQVGKEILEANRRGSPEKCFTIKNPVEINDYCALAYHDADMQVECKNPKQFCYMCCDAEIGFNNRDQNNCCYSRCDMVKKQSTCNEFYDMYHINDIIISHH